MDKEMLLKTYFSPWLHLTEPQKRLLLDRSEMVQYRKGTTIHCGSDECIGLLILQSGMIRTYLLSEEGKEVPLYRLEKGDMSILSASCVMPAITFDVLIDAEIDTEALTVSADTLFVLMEESVYVECFVYRLAAESFSRSMWAMQQILFMRFDRRLAIFLLDELQKISGDSFRMTHEQIAKYMGTAREVVTRMLKYFAEEGIVELSRGGVRVRNRKRLEEMARRLRGPGEGAGRICSIGKKDLRNLQK